MQVKSSDIFQLMLYISIVVTCMAQNSKIKHIFCVLEIIFLFTYIISSKIENKIEQRIGDEKND